MRRADRLFQILQLLRVRDSMTAAQLAAELEVSERTIYRDVRDLITSGVAIEGAAGVGYVLDSSFDLPPLMFTPGEIEALVAGVRLVEAMGDEQLAREARSVVAKVECALPEPLREAMRAVPIFAPDFHLPSGSTANVAELRGAVSARAKVRFAYEDRDGRTSSRTVRPLGLACWGSAWTLIGWCELRQDFRSFRTDRIKDLVVTGELVPDEPGRDLEGFIEQLRRERDGDAR